MITKEERLLLLLKWAPYITNFDIDEYSELYKQWYIDPPGEEIVGWPDHRNDKNYCHEEHFITCVEYINGCMENVLKPASDGTLKSILGRV